MAQHTNQLQNTKQFFSSEVIKGKFEELLGKKSQGFLTSVLQIINSNNLLASADHNSLYMAAATAATLDLPIQPSLGFAYIVPYKGQAQFQIGWKGLVQLAQRTGQYKSINVIEVYANQFKSYNSLTEVIEADWTAEGKGEVVGYCAFFSLLNGFEKTSYWTKEKVTKHASKYSQAFKSERGISPWKDKDQFHEMAKKTVLKNTLSKYGPMSIEMQKAVTFDQGVVEDIEHEVVSYPDNQIAETNHDLERLRLLLDEVQTAEEFWNALNKSTEEIKEELSFEIALTKNRLGINEDAV